jgi:hypothetical protein
MVPLEMTVFAAKYQVCSIGKLAQRILEMQWAVSKLYWNLGNTTNMRGVPQCQLEEDTFQLYRIHAMIFFLPWQFNFHIL